MEKEKNKKQYIKIALYLGLFLIIIILAKITKTNETKKQTTNTQEKIEILEKIKNINTEHYKEKIHFIRDDDATYLEFESINNVEIGIKKYHGEETNYIKKDDNYYQLNDTTFVPLTNFKKFEYDLTFTRPEVLKELINNLQYTKNSYISNDNNVFEITIQSNDTKDIYKKYSNNLIETYIDGEIKITINYKDDKINHILINTTDFYNSINREDYKNIAYYIELNELKEEDISWLLEKIN